MAMSDGQVKDSKSEIEKLISRINQLTEENKSLKEKMQKFSLEADEKYNLLFEKANDAIFLVKDDYFMECNDVALHMFGCSSKDQIIGKHPHEFSPKYQPDGQSSTEKALIKIRLALNSQPQFFEWTHCRLNEETFDAEVSLNSFFLEGEQYLLGIVRDVTKRKRLAYYDHLTNLPNRVMFFEKINNFLDNSRYQEEIKSLLYIDLDRFKSINDTMGHGFADELLVAFSKRIKNALRKNDFIGRIGGDEFVIILSKLGDDLEEAKILVNDIAEKLLHITKHPFNLPSGDMHVSVSIGITVFEVSDKLSVDSIIQEADLAMYHVKNDGGNAIQFYNKHMKEKLLKRLFLEKNLRRSLSENNLKLEYQPILDDKGNVICVEALSRWSTSAYGEVEPSLFVSIAEETGLITELGFNMMDIALRDINNLNQSLPEDRKLKVSVNISPFQLEQTSFIKNVEFLLKKHQIKKGSLFFEITENIFISDINMAMKKLATLKEMGIHILLDDFGTGYSSLNFASKLSINGIKIDKSFIDNIDKKESDVKMLEVFMSIGRHLNLDVIAEGVETEKQLKTLKDLGCKIFQGFLYSRPLKIGALYDFLHKDS